MYVEVSYLRSINPYIDSFDNNTCIYITGDDIQSHLQAMFSTLRPQDTIKVVRAVIS